MIYDIWRKDKVRANINVWDNLGVGGRGGRGGFCFPVNYIEATIPLVY